MKKKINIQMLVMVGIAIILTAILSIAVFYEVFKREMADSLARYTRLLSNTIENYEVNNIETLLSGENGILENEKNNGIRVSIIDKKGNVVYDNYYETSKLQDHSDRPEIEQAFKDGEGQQIRQSFEHIPFGFPDSRNCSCADICDMFYTYTLPCKEPYYAYRGRRQ